MPVFCFKCEKLFSSQSSLNRHVRTVHKSLEPVIIEYAESVGPYKCLEGCKVSFKRSLDLRQHLNPKHNISFTCETMEFKTYEEFHIIWLETEEQNRNVGFVKLRGTKRCREESNENTEKMYFDCVRSGYKKVKSDIDRKRNLKSQGSAKIDLVCTSQIIVNMNSKQNNFKVIYYPEHYGHDNEIQHLHLSENCRKTVASKLMSGVSATHILDTTRDNIKTKITRDDLITRKDILNIKKSYNIALQDGCRHSDDGTSVSLWVKECSANAANPVLFFKKQGEIIDIHYKLATTDFCLILMNQTQKEMLRKFGNNIVCVDGTHGLNSYDFELTTLLIIDEFGEGFPVAFLFSNRKDTYIYELFFDYVKSAVGGNIISNTFMSDITNVYYNAWRNIMGPTQIQLYCSWHVDRAWQQNLTKVQDIEKRKWVYKTLKYLQTNLDAVLFEKEYEEFLSLLDSSEATKQMSIYLKNYYLHNRRQWAYCYRKTCGINTNMFLESMHKVVKYVYLEGKKIKRLDKSLHALQKFVRDKTIDRIIKLTKGKSSNHLSLINMRHRVALTKNYYIINENNVNIISDGEGQDQVIVKKQSNICCELLCRFCNICIHMYECSCMDYTIKTTICKHIHFLCLNNGYTEAPSELLLPESIKKQEVNQLVKNLHLPTSNGAKTIDLKDDIKSAAIQLITNIDNFNYTFDEQVFIFKNLKVLMAIGGAESMTFEKTFNENIPKLRSPPNKRIEKQKLFSTKKKISQSANFFQKPDANERKIITETLSQSLFITNDPEHDHLY